MSYYHVSHVKLYDKVGLNIGGVQVFAQYLKRAIPELEIVSFSDLPNWVSYREKTEYEKAILLNEWLLEQGLGSDDVVVADGYWGLGLEGKVGRLISICHGSYYGRLVQSQINPWGQPVSIDDVEKQFELWEHPEVEVMCVARHALRELEAAGIVDERFSVILLGVDLDVFSPEGAYRTVFMHAATSALKGIDIIASVVKMFGDSVRIEPLNEWSGDPTRRAGRIRQAKATLVPSRYEGNPYFVQECLACGVPIIAHEVGAMCDMDGRVGLITDDLSPANFVRLIKLFLDATPDTYAPREWAEEHCDYRDFETLWRTYLDANSG